MTRSTGEAQRVGWVVDVQNDFMLPPPNGRLYVHNLFDPTDVGATQIIEQIIYTVEWMREHCALVVYTGDWHAYGDREIDLDSPDAAKDTYPPHCMGESPDEDERRGAALLGIIDPGPDALVLAREATPDEARDLGRRAVRERRPVFIEKREFSVFTGSPADAFLEGVTGELATAGSQTPEFIVCGVAADVCVRHAVEGLLDRSMPVRVVTDAIWGLGLEAPAVLLERWARRGAALTTTDELAGAAR